MSKECPSGETTEDIFALREIVLNTRKPIVLRNFQHKWTCFRNGLSKWCDVYDKNSESKPYFERIAILDAFEPQWERKRKLLQTSASEFLREHSAEQDYWSGMNYKRKQELPVECTEGVDFGCLGFAQVTDDCTFWLSSTGANTPCHYDTYGCNIVVQVFGRKSWLLLPPGSLLTPTRIPYEESSIYCRENLYAPNAKDKSHLATLKGQLYQCILEPNDVLIVPKHWWHFVEALEISLSVNAWIPLIGDLENQIEECISKHLIETFIKDKSVLIREHIMNPNQFSDIPSDEELFKVLEYLIKQKSIYDSGCTTFKKDCNKYDYQYLEEDKVKCLIGKRSFASEVPLMTNSEVQMFIDTNGNRHREAGTNKYSSDNPLSHIQETLINSVCSPNIVQLVKQEFFKRYNYQS